MRLLNAPVRPRTIALARGLIALVLALGPALVITPARVAWADSPQPGPSFTVNDPSDTNDGECSVDHCTLREAVLAANALPGLNNILLPAGTFVLDLVGAGEDAATTGDLDLTDDVQITGVTSATSIISGTYAAFGDRLFEITSTATVSISNVGLTGGMLPNWQPGDAGGGAVSNAGDFRLSASRVYSNFADQGGGIYSSISATLAISLTDFTNNLASSLGGGVMTLGLATVYSSTFTANTALNGGGLASGPDPLSPPGDQPVTIDASIFLSNTAVTNTTPLSGFGGGVFVNGVMTLTNSLLAGNDAHASGGGLSNLINSRLVVRDSAFTSNTSINAGGGLTNQGALDMADTRLTLNHAAEDGGGLASGNTLTLTRVLVAENDADDYAGGLFVGGFAPSNVIQNSAILSNTAPDGAGLYSEADFLTVLTTTIAGNSATGLGGGVFVDNVMTMTNVTVSGNQAGSHGGGIAAINPYAFSNSDVRLNNVSVVSNTTAGGDGGGLYAMLTVTVRLTNTLLAGNIDQGGQAPDCAGPLVSGGYNLLGSTTGCVLAGDLNGVVSNTAALLGPLADNGGSTLTHALLVGSPAVNAGNPAAPASSASACAPADQRGVARPFGPRCDIGAFESTNPQMPTVQLSLAAYAAPEAATVLPFTATLSAASGLTVTVSYTATPGSATPGADYVAATGVLTFAPGSQSAAGAISLLPDSLDEPDEVIFLGLANASHAALGVPTTATVTILDDDAPPAVQFSAAAYTTTEGAGPLTLTANLSAPSGLTVTVAYTTTPGTAVAGADYTPAGGMLTFTPGQQQLTLTVVITDDALLEGNETILLTLFGPTGATLGAPSTALLTIQDDEVENRIYLPLIMRS